MQDISENSKINIAIVGCGRIAKRHLGILTDSLADNFRVVGVCDINKTKATNKGSFYNVPAYFDLDEMLTQTRLDVLVILTESGNHAKNIITASEYALKYIIVEKPLALSLTEARFAIERCHEAGIKLKLIKQNRLNLPVTKLYEAVQKNWLGKLNLGTIRVRWKRDTSYYDEAEWRGTWALDGGALTNQASHHVDLLISIMGKVDSVFAYTSTKLVEIEAEDTAIAILKFKSGAHGVIEVTTAARPVDLEGSISILGTKGTVEVGGFAVNKILTWKFTDEVSVPPVTESYNENPANVYGFGHQKYYENFIKEFAGEDTFVTDAIEGLPSLELIHAIYESAETGKEVKLSGYYPNSKLGK